MASRKSYFAWHSWIGLTCGLMLFVICWSGTFAVFAHEVDWLLNPDLRAAPFARDMPWQGAHDAVRAAYPDWKIVDMAAPRYPGFAMEVLAEPEPDNSFRIYVDPNTLQILGDSSYFNVQRFFRSFHMSLFNNPAWGSIAGISTGYFAVIIFALPLVTSLVTSLVFYKRWWRGFFKLERRKGAKVFWSDIHKLTGVWSLWFVGIISLTCIWYFAEWYIPYREEPAATAPAPAPHLPINRLVDQAEKQFPELQITSISLYSAEDNIFSAIGHDGTVLVRPAASISLDMRSGETLDIYRPASEGVIARLTETADVLHFGTFGGLWSQALYFLFGLGLSGMILTGVYLHAKRQERRLDDGPNRPVLFAYAVTLVLLLMATGGGWVEINGYGLGGDWPEVSWPVTLFLATWVLSTIGILSWWVLKLNRRSSQASHRSMAKFSTSGQNAI
jgi:uncharacterized iron-regulated membrane protein